MKIRGHGNGVAIALAGLAVVLAASGTAYAVATSTVTIADPTVPSRVVHVDAAGRLQAAEATSPIDSSGLLFGLDSADNFVTSPTRATLAITKITLTDPSINSSATSANVRFYLYQSAVSGSSCSSTTGALLGIYNISPGQNFEDVFSSPLLVKPVGTAQYCLDLFGSTLGGASYNANYVPAYDLTGYVVGGAYTGIGASAVHSTPRALSRREAATTGR